MKKTPLLFRLISFIGLLIISTNGFTQSIIPTQADRTQVGLNESFHVTFTLDKTSYDAQPDFSALHHAFIILGNSQSTQVMITNGQSKSQYQRILTLSPKKTGDLSIPAIAFGNKLSQPITIKVTETPKNQSKSTADPIFLEVTVNPKQAYLNSEVIYTTRLYYANDFTHNASLTAPKSNDALIMHLGEDKHYQSRQQGKLYQVLERNYALFPQKSGRIVIEPPVFSGIMRVEKTKFDRYDSFFGYTTKPIRLSGQSFTLKVKPIPKAFANQTFTPAKSLTLTQAWSNPKKNQSSSEPITRTITLKAVGLRAEQLPDLSTQTVEGVNQYDEKPTLRTQIEKGHVVGTKTLKMAYLPINDQLKVSLPGITLTWFNTETQRRETATLSGKTYTFSKPTLTKTENEPVHVSTKETTLLPLKTNNDPLSGWPRWALGSFFALLLLSLFIIGSLLRKTRRLQRTLDNPTQANCNARAIVTDGTHSNKKSAWKRIHTSCKNADPHATKKAIIEWAQCEWPENNLLNLHDVTQHIDNKKVHDVIRDLNTTIYSPTANQWDGEIFWAQFQLIKQSIKSQKNKVEHNALADLYPSP